MKKINITLSIEEDLKIKFKSSVSLVNKEMSEVVSELIIGWLEEKDEEMKAKKTKREEILKVQEERVPPTKEELEASKLYKFRFRKEVEDKGEDWRSDETVVQMNINEEEYQKWKFENRK